MMLYRQKVNSFHDVRLVKHIRNAVDVNRSRFVFLVPWGLISMLRINILSCKNLQEMVNRMFKGNSRILPTVLGEMIEDHRYFRSPVSYAIDFLPTPHFSLLYR